MKTFENCGIRVQNSAPRSLYFPVRLRFGAHFSREFHQFSKSFGNSTTRTVTGFTLIEIVVAITILAVIMVSVFEIYTRVMTINRRLELSRQLQESARLVTETIAEDIRRNGIDFNCYKNDPTACGVADYSWSGTDILATKEARYYLMEDSLVTMSLRCSKPDGEGCYLWKELSDGTKLRLTPPEVKINNLRFYVSGVDSKSFSNSSDSEWKATIVFNLAVAPKSGIDPESVKTLVIPVQTTISEKLYKAR